MAQPAQEAQEQQKVLVVDDDARLRTLLQRYLEEQGYMVKAVADAEQMDRALGRELYSLMVLDLMLPGEDGLSICKRLRESENYGHLPIIMLTAKGDDNDYKGCNWASLVQGCCRVMSRPEQLESTQEHSDGKIKRRLVCDLGTRHKQGKKYKI